MLTNVETTGPCAYAAKPPPAVVGTYRLSCLTSYLAACTARRSALVEDPHRGAAGVGTAAMMDFSLNLHSIGANRLDAASMIFRQFTSQPQHRRSALCGEGLHAGFVPFQPAIHIACHLNVLAIRFIKNRIPKLAVAVLPLCCMRQTSAKTGRHEKDKMVDTHGGPREV
jgi:hypothetical protein